jgi:hypothetical protein
VQARLPTSKLLVAILGLMEPTQATHLYGQVEAARRQRLPQRAALAVQELLLQEALVAATAALVELVLLQAAVVAEARAVLLETAARAATILAAVAAARLVLEAVAEAAALLVILMQQLAEVLGFFALVVMVRVAKNQI